MESMEEKALKEFLAKYGQYSQPYCRGFRTTALFASKVRETYKLLRDFYK